jgi:hypothetical protein
MNRDPLPLAFAWLTAALACAFALLLYILFAILFITHAHARDDGQFTNAPLHDWFNGLKSQQGLCCSFADGFSIADPDIDTRDGTFMVHLCATYQDKREAWPTCADKVWIAVPENAMVHEPNRFGPAVVWPERGVENRTRVRCFLPGAGT